jgi:hypothetical protein
MNGFQAQNRNPHLSLKNQNRKIRKSENQKIKNRKIGKIGKIEKSKLKNLQSWKRRNEFPKFGGCDPADQKSARLRRRPSAVRPPQ